MMRPAQQLAAQRKRVAHNCAHCGAKFIGLKKALYCPDKHCRQLAHKLRNSIKQTKCAQNNQSASGVEE